jgi:hypothetical protein
VSVKKMAQACQYLVAVSSRVNNILSRVSKNFIIAIQQSSRKLLCFNNITITYVEGHVEKRRYFDLDNNLKLSKSKIHRYSGIETCFMRRSPCLKKPTDTVGEPISTL